ncbi:cytochrome-c peroxidase [Thalassococcus sp. BH17M4-6]|uniref:cytochrome-c peroxidase n=1 Tax=Thalassococcus sp. BH17M4-6 TaxID=3413148 RepID=UPI003BBE6ADF
MSAIAPFSPPARATFAAALCAALLAAAVQAGPLSEKLPKPVTDADYRPVDEAAARLGQLLFYDPILSGNKEVACATCHHPRFGTGDGLSLSLGDGGIGLGPDRVADPDNPPEQRVPRNAQALFNLGAHEFTVLFHDGRIEVDPTRPGGLRTPLAQDMVAGFDSLLSAQSMFPVLSPDEMAGHFGENEVSAAVRKGELTGPGGGWDLIARRVAAVPAYAQSFAQVYPEITDPSEIGFTDISNALASFIEFEWRSDTAPFDSWLRGAAELAPEAEAGAMIFYGWSGCADCHAGKFQTDHGFHATGEVQIGPGKARRFEDHARDPGRFGVTGRDADLYAFRTPSLRNVALTAPYGHAGAFADLKAYVAAHSGSTPAFDSFEVARAVLPSLPVDDMRIVASDTDRAAVEAARVDMRPLSDEELRLILAFLDSLTDPVAKTGRLGVPETVPSGLKVPN